VTRPGDLPALLRHLLRLKAIPRTGWLDRGVPAGETESVADHILMTTLLGWLTAGPELDRDRVLKLALVHDLAEAITGDPPPYDRDDVPPADDRDAVRAFFSRRHVRSEAGKATKRRDEAVATATLRALMPEAAGAEIAALWQEYEAQESAEARFAKDLDRFEAFLQSREYARQHPSLPLSGFTKMALEELETPALIALRDAILAEEREP
jgi:putative hydrolase of HD superfamily